MASRDLTRFYLSQLEGLVFAPSRDQTDEAGQLSLYVADSGRAEQVDGKIVELSLVQPPAAGASDFQFGLIRTTNLAAITPPSPDPSGLTYLPNSSTLLMTDGEVDETVSGITHFAGANVWELSLGAVS